MNMLNQINPEEREQLQKIWDTDYQTIVRGKDNGVPFLTYVFKLHKKIFGKTCSSCPYELRGYIKKLKSLNTNNQMENKSTSNFVLSGTTTIPVPGTSIVYSNANLTDEIALSLLRVNPNRKALFSKLPSNIDELLAEITNDDSENLVKVGDKNLTIEQVNSLLVKASLKTRATTVQGVQNFIDKLAEEKRTELIALSLEIKDEIVITATSNSDDAPRNREDILFDLDKANQDLEELEAEEEKNEEAIKEAKENVEKFQKELDNVL